MVKEGETKKIPFWNPFRTAWMTLRAESEKVHLSFEGIGGILTIDQAKTLIMELQEFVNQGHERGPIKMTNESLPDPRLVGAEYKKTATVWACEMYVDFEVVTANGNIAQGRKGDYLARGPHEDLWPITKEIFESTYKPTGKKAGDQFVQGRRVRSIL